MKQCPKCKRSLPIKCFYPCRDRKASSYCKKCLLKYASDWGKQHPGVISERSRKKRIKLRQEVLTAYGGKSPQCNCCGENDTHFLVIDHINNDGHIERKKYGTATFYKRLRQNGFPKDKYQILCHNCNAAKSLYGECPHRALEHLPN